MWIFYALHIGAFAIHVFNCIAGAVILSSRGSVTTELIQSSLQYTEDASVNLHCPIRYPIHPSGFGAKDATVCSGIRFDGQLVLVVSEAFTALAHLFYIANLYYRHGGGVFIDVFSVGFNPYRYVEYAFTATSLSLVSLVGTGVREVAALLIATFALVAVQILGAMSEAATAHVRFAEARVKGQGLRTISPSRLVQIISFVVASILQTCVFLVVFLYVYSMDSNPPGKREYTGFRSQSFVYVSQYLFFPIVAGLYAFAPKHSRFTNFAYIEYLYIVAGVWAKTAIFWMVFAAVRELTEDYLGVARATGVNWRTVRLFAIWGPPLLNTVFAAAGFFSVRPRSPHRVS